MGKRKGKSPVGIGGWLILPTVGLFLGVVLYGFLAIVSGLAIFLGVGGWWSWVYLMVSLSNLPLVVYTLWLELKKRRDFVKCMIIVAWLSVAVAIILSIEEGDYNGIALQFLSTILWTCYFCLSKRVENTFKN